MRKNRAFRIATSTLVAGVVTVGCSPSGQRPVALSAAAPDAVKDAAKDAAKAHERAGIAFRQGNLAEALAQIELAVQLAPRDVGYRMVLGDLYLKNGRFLSAEQAFDDVIALDPGNVRAGMSAALAQIAQGKNNEALERLASLENVAPATDLGLAYALAGQPHRAIAMLEPAARAPEADGRTRQNLALAYAFAGEWAKAQVTAAQDVSPGELSTRMQQWAALASQRETYSAVAWVLGIANVVADGGQPAQLALAPEPVEVAAAAPIAIQPAPVVPAQVLAEAVKIEAPLAAEPVPAAPQVAKAVETLVKAPAVLRTQVPASAPLPAFKPAAQRISFEPDRPKADGRFVVQIGAYRSQAQAEKAWTMAMKSYSLADHEPLSTTVALPGRGTFHRLSVSGFGTYGEAGKFCRSIKARGGACFVRTHAGDAPVQWASRKSGPRG